MPVIAGNLYENSGAPGAGETTDVLSGIGSVRIERILSRAQASPEGFWYDQAQPEWVVLLRGSATLSFAGQDKMDLQAGDYLLIPAHLKHRVDRVSEDALWLAVHFV